MMVKSSRDIYLPALAIGAAGVALYLVLREDEDGNDTVRTVCDHANDPGRTLSEVDVAIIVARLREAFYGDIFWEDEDDVIASLLLAESDADIYAIACRFGTWAPIFADDRTLFAAVRDYLEPDQVDELNASLSAKGIGLSF